MASSKPEIREIEIAKLSPNDYNPNVETKAKYKALVNHFREVGFTDPLKVRKRDPKDPDTIQTEYVLIDGEHRLRAYREVFPEAETIMCAVCDLTRAGAVVSTIAYNEIRGDENPIKMAVAIKIAVEGGKTIEEIETLTGMRKSRVEAYAELQEMPEGEKLPKFEDEESGQEDAPNPREPVVISFAVYEDEREIIERAITKAKRSLPPETDIDEERGKSLVILSEEYLRGAGTKGEAPAREGVTDGG